MGAEIGMVVRTWRVVGWLAVLAAGCRGAGHPGDNRPPGGPPVSPFEEAQRYERGDGVERDYTRALRIYEGACADGAGPPAACRKLAMALLTGRGEASKPLAPGPLLQAACDHGEWLACFPPITYFPDLDAARAACNSGTPEACFAVSLARPFSQSGSVNEEQNRLRDRACQSGVLDACLNIVSMSLPNPLPLAVTEVAAACKAGDADACTVQKTPLPDDVLCKAHDLRACKRAHPPVSADPCADFAVRRVPAGRRRTVALTGRLLAGAPWPPATGVPYIFAFGGQFTIDWGIIDIARALAPDVRVYVEYREEVAAGIPAGEPTSYAPAISFLASPAEHLEIGHWLPPGNAGIIDAHGEVRAGFSIDGPSHKNVDAFVRCARTVLGEP